jgi:transcriptional regulator with XRE-family HTH domain
VADPERKEGTMDDTVTEDWFDPQTTTFGDRLTGAREAAGLSQAELARRLGVKIKTLRAWEGDQSEPRANRLSMLCGILNVPLTWLLTGVGTVSWAASVTGQDGQLLEEIGALRREATGLVERLGLIEARLRARLGEG